MNLLQMMQGFTWGSSPTDLLPFLSPSHDKFDLILLSDLVFNHSQHPALLDSCLACLSDAPPKALASQAATRAGSLPEVDLSTQRSRRGPVVLCFFSHHRPWLVEADLGILKVAEEKGWKTEKVWEDKEAGVSRSRGLACVQRVMNADAGALAWCRSRRSRRTVATWRSGARCTGTRSGASEHATIDQHINSNEYLSLLETRRWVAVLRVRVGRPHEHWPDANWGLRL